jgi:hypothetical protein
MADADRLREQYEEAERIMREAEQAAARAAGDVPPRGWEAPGDRSSGFPDLGQLAALVDSLRAAIPPELARQFADAVRELLLAIRAVLDWYIARLEPSEPRSREVRDIPIE